MRYLVYLLLLCAACQPDPTPFPVNIPPTATDPSAVQAVAVDEPQPIRYGLAASMTGMSRELVLAGANVELLAEPPDITDLGTRFDVMVTYGELAGAALSPLTPHVSLLINTNVSPLDNEALSDILRRAVNARSIVNILAIPGMVPNEQIGDDPLALRTALANGGLPDGFEVVGAVVYTLGSAALQSTLHSAGIDSRWGTLTPDALFTAFRDGRVHLALVTWTSTEQRVQWEMLAGTQNMIDLFSVPISYLAADGLTITFAPNGLPLATR